MSLGAIFVDLLNSDMETMFKEIIEEYGDAVAESKKADFTLEKLIDTFKITDIKRVGQPELVNKTRKKVENCNRCMARIWGSTPPVAYYCEIKKKYIYGQRCTKPKNGDSDYCKLHSKNLPHGKFGELPPHEHFEKYL